jgi:hypothetical protein
MNIHYRVVKVDPSAHGLVIRYYTDKVTEMDLANSFNEDGSVKMNADGYPISTRTDVFMSIYDIPAPDQQEIDRRIKLNAPVDWLKLQEDIKDPNVNTKMTELRNLTGEEQTFTTQDIDNLKVSLVPNTPIDEADAAQSNTQRAYETVVNFLDSIKVLAEKDPSIVEELKKTLNTM